MFMERLRLVAVIPAPPEVVYAAWLDPEEHGRFTGGAATCDAKVGGAFTAWDGYIEGRHVLLEPGRRIVQRWRTSEFPEDAPDSKVEILFEPAAEGQTRLVLIHTDIPEDQGAQYQQGWSDHYFEPMKTYFGK